MHVEVVAATIHTLSLLHTSLATNKSIYLRVGKLQSYCDALSRLSCKNI